jgi:hypothetical protein
MSKPEVTLSTKEALLLLLAHVAWQALLFPIFSVWRPERAPLALAVGFAWLGIGNAILVSSAFAWKARRMKNGR